MNRMIRLASAAALLTATLFANAGDAFPGAKKRLDVYFDSLQQQGQVSGSIAISERGVTRYQRSVGFATIENGTPQPADGGTRYRIGEVTQLFTAALTLQLAEQASLTLDNKLAEFYPELPDAIRISYRDLLQDRSGLGDYAQTPGFAATRTTPRTHAEMLRLVTARGTEFPAGTRLQASNSNYLVLGYVLEKVQNRSYDEILRRQITSRLALVRTYFAGAGGATTLESVSYEWSPQGWRPLPDDDPSVGGGASGLVSNAGDLVTFLDALFAGKVVSSYNLGNMREQQIALRPIDLNGMSCLGLFGHTAGYDAFACHFPERRISLAWTGNASRLAIAPMIAEAVRLFDGKLRKPPRVVRAGSPSHPSSCGSRDRDAPARRPRACSADRS